MKFQIEIAQNKNQRTMGLQIKVGDSSRINIEDFGFDNVKIFINHVRSRLRKQSIALSNGNSTPLSEVIDIKISSTHPTISPTILQTSVEKVVIEIYPLDSSLLLGDEDILKSLIMAAEEIILLLKKSRLMVVKEDTRIQKLNSKIMKSILTLGKDTELMNIE